MELQTALSKIQREINVPKSQRNTFGNYNYRSCEDIVEAVKKLLPEGVTLTLDDELVLVGSRYYVRAVARLSDGKNSIETKAYARESETKKGMDESQITGATSSYARKYALNGLLLIDDARDADTQDNTKEAKSPADYKVVIKGLLADLGKTPKTVAEANEVVKQITGLDFKPANFPQIAEMLKIKKEELTS